jgi:DNA/RNA-binding domain of Phe-tRNA-synthetase-like protein
MKLAVTADVFDLFPDARIALVVCRGLSNRTSPEEAEELSRTLRASQDRALAAFGDAPISEHPRIRCWREAYRAFGAKPKDNPSSIESLLRRSQKGEPLRHINKLVDLYNVVSLTHFLPAGGEDLDRLEGDLFLTRASADEAAVMLLGEREARAPKPGEIIYKDANGAICRRWNWKEAERSKLTEETTNALLVLEAIPPIAPAELDGASAALSRMVLERCGGTVTQLALDRERHEVSLG